MHSLCSPGDGIQLISLFCCIFVSEWVSDINVVVEQSKYCDTVCKKPAKIKHCGLLLIIPMFHQLIINFQCAFHKIALSLLEKLNWRCGWLSLSTKYIVDACEFSRCWDTHNLQVLLLSISNPAFEHCTDHLSKLHYYFILQISLYSWSKCRIF